MEYQRIGAWWHGPVVSTDAVSSSWRAVSWNAAGAGCWVVFGTLLGPEATGPGWGSWLEGCGSLFPGLFVSGFLAAPSARSTLFVGVVCGVCGLGLLFENYIVDASIFYKKQFPRI